MLATNTRLFDIIAVAEPICAACGQVAVHLTTGLEGALQQCLRHLGPAYSTAALPNLHRATVRQAALRVSRLHPPVALSAGPLVLG